LIHTHKEREREREKERKKDRVRKVEKKGRKETLKSKKVLPGISLFH